MINKFNNLCKKYNVKIKAYSLKKTKLIDELFRFIDIDIEYDTLNKSYMNYTILHIYNHKKVNNQFKGSFSINNILLENLESYDELNNGKIMCILDEIINIKHINLHKAINE